MNAIIPQAWLQERLQQPGIVIVDCRFQLGKPESGHTEYQESHIPGAVYLDLEKDLSAPVGEHGGRHPLPDIVDLSVTFSRAGIGNESIVVAYDDQGGAMASRLWWLLTYLGHEKVYVLDEGFTAWKQAGLPVTEEQTEVVPARFIATVQHSMLAEVYDVRDTLGTDRAVLIDSREAARYRGEVEPIDRVAGHIPGAVNRFWKDALDARGAWKPAVEQAARFDGIPQDAEIIVYCGSGVTATPNVLALREAGFTSVKLYAGSWSDWISYEGNPVAVGEEEERKG
ncbi:sulfurtransferase [Paenibacillus gansuensis]|uniref:Sulfurtransferase n=1 Tax=Paenibacillus gansuensis TaxID=306542 RepID=A0ABW5PHA7_9BACL